MLRRRGCALVAGVLACSLFPGACLHVGRVGDHQIGCSPADDDLHILFSTSCKRYERWQAEVLLNSAYHIGQCGKITWIVVGCEKEEWVNQTAAEALQSVHPKVAMHLAPSIPDAKSFPYFNKPWAFHHWLQSQQSLTERAYAIIDPDEFFLQPLTQHGGLVLDDGVAQTGKSRDPKAVPPLLLSSRRMPGQNVTDVVEPGWSVAQQFGLGGRVLEIFDQKQMCPGGEASPCARMSDEEARAHFAVGPPYILHRNDFRKVVPDWWNLMKPVYAKDKGDIQADMYAYIFAAKHNGVRHHMLDNYMVSNSRAYTWGEAWPFVDTLESMSCHNPSMPAGHGVPGFIHLCQGYKACTRGDSAALGCSEQAGSAMWQFHKRALPEDIFDCQKPMLVEPPDNFFNVQAGNVEGKRSAFMICNAIHLVNRAVYEYKEKFCKPSFNAKQCIQLGSGYMPVQDLCA